MKHKPTVQGTIAIVAILIIILIMGAIEAQPAQAGTSLAEQRRQRELDQSYRHEMELAELEAQTRRYEAKRYSRQRRSSSTIIIYPEGYRNTQAYRPYRPTRTVPVLKGHKHNRPGKRVSRAN